MAESPSSWIRLNRSLLMNDLWLSEPFTRGQAWADLLLLANFKEGQITRRGVRITVKRGQVGYSQEHLGLRWKWSKGKVLRFLKELQNGERITVQTGVKNLAISALITITNYDLYQGDGTVNEPVNGDENGDVNGTGTRRKKEGKEGKEEKTSPPLADGEGGEEKPEKPEVIFTAPVMWISHKMAELILQNNPKNRELQDAKREATVLRWAKDIDKMIRIDGRDARHVAEVVIWCQHDPFWSQNILSGAKLREQYDKLTLKMKGAALSLVKPAVLVGRNKTESNIDAARKAAALLGVTDDGTE